jgi:hypothetical protein
LDHWVAHQVLNMSEEMCQTLLGSSCNRHFFRTFTVTDQSFGY